MLVTDEEFQRIRDHWDKGTPYYPAPAPTPEAKPQTDQPQPADQLTLWEQS